MKVNGESILALLLAVALAIAYAATAADGTPPAVDPSLPVPVVPGPAPIPEPIPAPRPRRPCPFPRPWPRGDEAGPASPGAGPGRPVVGGKVSPDGKTEVACDLPESEKFHNKGGRDGAGLCVFASITWAARYQNERTLFDLFDKMRKEPGGGYPQKVDRMLAKYGAGVQYGQHTGGDPAILDAILGSGRMAAVTYSGRDPHYSGGISHMVDLVYLDQEQACVSDNNYPGDDQFVWMNRAEFLKRWGGSGKGWCVFLLSPPPPPVARNWSPK
jgi:hypothetical protein